uniref:Uncharacterized protein n=1 Tax=Arundo donax TaxID=35708 RepID=A0A0A8YLY5_ARUDO
MICSNWYYVFSDELIDSFR